MAINPPVNNQNQSTDNASSNYQKNDPAVKPVHTPEEIAKAKAAAAKSGEQGTPQPAVKTAMPK
ncbi:MAG: hypothetical protein ACK5O1_05955 [Holosporales bacterium]|jgi:hypothetical protein